MTSFCNIDFDVQNNRAQSVIDMAKHLESGISTKPIKNDLNNCKIIIENKGVILCDDYDLTYAPGVKEAIDEFISINSYKINILFNRFAEITKS